MSPGITVRAATSEDLAFVFSSWLKSYRTAPSVAGVSPRVYFKNQHDAIERLLERAACLVACPEDDPGTILGFVVLEPLEGATAGTGAVIHWICVKYAFRRMGIARRLLAGVDLSRSTFTHRPAGSEWIARTCPGLSFNPYAT